MSSWGDVLVQWCNCLQLTTKIKDINELRNNDFFKNVLHILKKLNTSDEVDRSFFQLVALLNDTYKYAQIDDIHSNSFMEISEDKLIIITSLLMHYTCLYDGRDSFTQPLCQNLSKKVQQSIKDFLENVNKEVTYSDLEELIGNDKIYESVESKVPKSPLTAVFRTPSLKRKFNYEKDKTVTKLKTALELEQFQKADMEEDLKAQIKKNQKLEKSLSKCNDEITALKSELFKLKCQTPPQFSKKPNHEHDIKLLRKELENIHQYVAVNEKEQEQLREEHYLYKKKIDEYELEYAELRQKYLAYDEQIDELTEMLNDKCSKIDYLETYCKELKDILEGYRQQKPSSHESSFSEDISNHKTDITMVNPENLASAVIEIQLKESQELNNELKSKVNLLNAELTTTKNYLDSRVKENNELHNKLITVSRTLKEFNKDFHNIKQCYAIESAEFNTSLSYLQREVNKFSSLHTTSLDNLNAEIERRNEINKCMLIEVTNLKNDVANITTEKELYIADYKSLDKKNQLLSTKIEELQSELKNAIDESCFKEKTLEDIIENNKNEMEKLTFDNKELKNQIDIFNKTVEAYCMKINTLQDEIKQKQTEITELITEKTEYLQDIATLKLQNDSLSNNSEVYSNKITNLEEIIKQKELRIDEILSNNDEYINEITLLKDQIRLLGLESENYMNKLKILEKSDEQNSNEINELNCKTKLLIDECAILKQNNASLTSKLQECNEQVKSLEDKNKQKEIVLEELNSIIETLKNDNSLLNTKLEDFCSHNKTLSDEIKHYENQLSEVSTEKENLKKDINILQEQNCNLSSKSEELYTKTNDLKQIIEENKKNLLDLDTQNKMYVKEIDNLKKQNICLNENITEYCRNIKNLECTIDQNNIKLKELEGEKKDNKVEHEYLKEQNEILQNRSVEYLNQNKALEDIIETNKQELEEKIQYITKIESDIDVLKNQWELEKTEQLKSMQLLEVDLKEKETLIDLNRTSINKYKNSLSKLKEEMLNTKINLNELKQTFVDEKHAMLELINNLIVNNKELTKTKDAIVNEMQEELFKERTCNENLKENIKELEKMFIVEEEKISNDLKNFEADTNHKNMQLEDSKKKNNELSNQMILLQELFDNLKLEKDNYLHEIEKHQAKILELEGYITNLKMDHESSTSENVRLQEIIYKYKTSIKKFELFQHYMKQHIGELKGLHKKEFQDYNNLILKLKTSIEGFSEKLVESETLREKMQIELNDCKESNSSLLSNLESLKSEIVKINDDWAEDRKQKEKIINENHSLRDNYIELTKTIKLFNEKLNKIIRTLKERKNESDSKLNDIHRVYQETNTGDLLKTPEKNHKSNDMSIEIDSLGERISKLNAYIDIFSEKEIFYLRELETLKEELAASNCSRFDVIENLKEQISDNEYQISTQTENLHAIIEKYNLIQTENQEYLVKIERCEEEMKNIKREHTAEVTLRDVRIENLQEKNNCLEEEMATLKKTYNSKLEENIEKIIILENQKSKNEKEIDEYKERIMYLEAQIAIYKEEILQVKNRTGKTQEEYETSLASLQIQVVRSKLEITELKKKNEELTSVNKDLIDQINEFNLKNEKDANCRERIEERLTEEIKLNIQLQNEKGILLDELQSHRELQDRYKKIEEENNTKKFWEEKHVELSQKVDTLMKSIEMQKDSYETFKTYYKNLKNDFNKLLAQKNTLESLTSNIRTQIILLNRNYMLENQNKFMEKKESLDIVSEDIMKQYNRYSKQINEMAQEFIGYFEKNCDNIFASLELKTEEFLAKYNIHEFSDQVSDLTERAVDILEQIKSSQKEYDNLCKLEQDKTQQKENILGTSRRINIDKIKEDDLKKKNVALKQKVTLLENTKSNLEKTVKKLREENKKLKENESHSGGCSNDLHYNMLHQEFIAYKEEHEKILTDYKSQLELLQKEYQDHKDNCMRSSTPVENRTFSNYEKERHLEADLEKLQAAFSKVRISNDKMENENVYLKQIIEKHKDEISKFTSIKEAYDKLLEENNKLMTEVDTMKYKRARDRDEFLRWLKKERSENDSRSAKQIQNIKAEYEMKLEKMKDKMIRLYREEVNKEMSKIKERQNESTPLLKTIERLECELFEAKQKIQLLSEKEMRKTQEHNPFLQTHGSNSQLNDLDSLSLKDFPLSCMNSTAVDTKSKSGVAKLMEFKHPSKVNPSSLDTRKQYEERQVKTLPRSGTIVEEISIRRRTSFGVPNSMGNLHMEDEEEMFNNKYLTDLKQGKCDLPFSSEDRNSRVSELAWRNSLVPPHLKSSYPAETQFCSPERFREDDIKTTGAFDDSLSKLLPNEKRKKDFGTTSYKKPGPPTPSKNGGRLSLTGGEMHVTKDQHSESKRRSPGRIRSLFTGKSSSRSSIEVTVPHCLGVPSAILYLALHQRRD